MHATRQHSSRTVRGSCVLRRGCLGVTPEGVPRQVAGEHKVVAVEDEADAAQLLRTLAEAHAGVPQWRRQRPCLLADAAHFFPGPGADVGTLTLRWRCHALPCRCGHCGAVHVWQAWMLHRVSTTRTQGRSVSQDI